MIFARGGTLSWEVGANLHDLMAWVETLRNFGKNICTAPFACYGGECGGVGDLSDRTLARLAVLRTAVHTEQNNTTLNDGYLGSLFEEERSEV